MTTATTAHFVSPTQAAFDAYMIAAPACACSDYQLAQVGCDCDRERFAASFVMVEDAPKPAKAKATFGKRVCPECGETFTAGHPNAQFCNPAHKLAFHNRQKGRAHVIAYAMAWRGSRNAKAKLAEGEAKADLAAKRRAVIAKADRRRTVGKMAFGEMCRLLDQFTTEDRLAGRPSMEAYVSGLERRQLWAQSTAYK